jgi:A/G-specific adenine glycosylase
MDFGAVICKPFPLCNICVFKEHCFAFNNDFVSQLPVKEKKLKIATRYFNYLVIEYNKKIYIRKRAGNDIWKSLHEFVLIETDNENRVKDILAKAEKQKVLKKDSYKILSVSPFYIQQLSHQKIIGRFIKIASENQLSLPGFKLISLKQLSLYAFPRLITAYFERGHS